MFHIVGVVQMDTRGLTIGEIIVIEDRTATIEAFFEDEYRRTWITARYHHPQPDEEPLITVCMDDLEADDTVTIH